MGSLIPNAQVELTRTGLEIGSALTYEQYDTIYHQLFGIKDASVLALGDLLNWGEDHMESWSQVLPEGEARKTETLMQYMRVSRLIPKAHRRPGLSWTHHQIVAKQSLSLEERATWLEQADTNGWSTADMKARVPGYSPPTTKMCRHCGKPI